MDTNHYLILLFLGIAIVVIDGQILYHSGKRYLSTYGGGESARSMVRLIVVLFHLVVLGVLALVSTIDIGGSGLEAIITRLGVVLLLVAVAHGAALALLARIRENEQVEQADPLSMDHQRAASYEPVVNPIPPQPGQAPQVSGGLESGGPYSASN